MRGPVNVLIDMTRGGRFDLTTDNVVEAESAQVAGADKKKS